MEYYIDCPLSKEISNQLAAGDTVFLSGVIYTARDAAHKRIYEAIIENRQIPIELKDNTIY